MRQVTAVLMDPYISTFSEICGAEVYISINSLRVMWWRSVYLNYLRDMWCRSVYLNQLS